MVDIANSRPATVETGEAAAVTARCFTGNQDVLSLIDTIADDAIVSSYQAPSFLRAWILESPHEQVFLSFAAKGHGPVLLPLERVGRRLSYPGERQANGNFPLGRAGDIEALAAIGSDGITRALAGLPLRADSIVLERQLQTLGGAPNPFVFETSPASPNPALSLSLEGTFDDVLDRHSGKRRRKRFRQQERVLDKLGGYEYIPRVPKEDVAETLARFFELKAGHFEAMGAPDVFASDHVQRFYRRLFEAPVAEDQAAHELKALEVQGEKIAIIGCTTHAGQVTGEFGTFDPSYAQAGPGELLFFLAIREATEAGVAIYDFGIGDEPYKRAWCEIETTHRDTVIPLSARGHVQSWMQTGRNRFVRSLKGNRRVWSAAKQIRRRIPLLR